MKIITRVIVFATLLASLSLHAETIPDDSDALKGVTTGKVIFDINMSEAKKMTLYLMVIKQTVDDLKRQGVKPDVILAFRGL